MKNIETIKLEYLMTSEEMQEGILVFNPSMNKTIQTIHIVLFVISILGFSTLLLEAFFFLKIFFVPVAVLLLGLNIYSIFRHYQMQKQIEKSKEEKTFAKEVKHEIEITKDKLSLITTGNDVETYHFDIEQISRVKEDGEYIFLIIERGEELPLFIMTPQKVFLSENEMNTFLEYTKGGVERRKNK